MNGHRIYDYLNSRRERGKKSLAVLIDPDKTKKLDQLLRDAERFPPDLFLVGSSIHGDENMNQCIGRIRKHTDVPVVLFPGNATQVTSSADALLLLSVISSRNPDLLIGRQVEASIKVKQAGLEVIPTGYILVESGALTTVQYISQSLPVPRHKPEIAVATALAGEQLGMKAIYLEAGSGAQYTVPEITVSAVRKSISSLLFTGGGITSAEMLHRVFHAGTDVAVVGNALEANPELLQDLVTIKEESHS